MTAGVAVSRASRSTQTAYGSARTATVPRPRVRLLLPSQADTYIRKGGHGGKEQLGISWPGSPRQRSPSSASSPTRRRRSAPDQLRQSRDTQCGPPRAQASGAPRTKAKNPLALPATVRQRRAGRVLARRAARVAGRRATARWTRTFEVMPGDGRARRPVRTPSPRAPASVPGSDGVPHRARGAVRERRTAWRSASAPAGTASMESPDPDQEDRRRREKRADGARDVDVRARSARRSSSSRSPRGVARAERTRPALAASRFGRSPAARAARRGGGVETALAAAHDASRSAWTVPTASAPAAPAALPRLVRARMPTWTPPGLRGQAWLGRPNQLSVPCDHARCGPTQHFADVLSERPERFLPRRARTAQAAAQPPRAPDPPAPSGRRRPSKSILAGGRPPCPRPSGGSPRAAGPPTAPRPCPRPTPRPPPTRAARRRGRGPPSRPARRPAGTRPRAPGPGRPASEGCTRAITKVGEVTAPRTPRPSPRPAGQRRLAGAELAGEHHEIAGAQQLGQPAAQLPHLLGGLDGDARHVDGGAQPGRAAAAVASIRPAQR